MAAELIIAGVFLVIAIGMIFGIHDLAQKGSRRNRRDD